MRNHAYTAILALALALSMSPVSAKEFSSSIKVKPLKDKPDGFEEMNTPRLLKLAKISKERAKQIAHKKYSGRFGEIDLENEDGNLIWSVEVGKHELAIDAGNGKILMDE